MRKLANVNMESTRVDMADRATVGQLLDMLGDYESAADRAVVASYAARLMGERRDRAKDVWMFQVLAEAYQTQAAVEGAAKTLHKLCDAVEHEFALEGVLADGLRRRLFGDVQAAESVAASDSASTADAADTGQHGAMSAKPEPKARDIAPKPTSVPKQARRG